jgi:hypothetical protein
MRIRAPGGIEIGLGQSLSAVAGQEQQPGSGASEYCRELAYQVVPDQAPPDDGCWSPVPDFGYRAE